MSKLVPEIRFKEFSGEWEEKNIKDILNYERPDKYIVKNTNYNNKYNIPVLTANKSFILGYTNENEGIYSKTPVIIFDDFTTDNKYVDFAFKIKSSAIKILKEKDNNNIKFIYELIQNIKFQREDHKRYYISEYQNIKILIPPTLQEQQKIADTFSSLDNLIETHTQKLELLKEHKKGLMQKLFPRDEKKVPEIRFKEFSGEWEEDKLINLAVFRRGSFPQPYGLEKWYDDKNGIPFIQVYDVDDNFKLKSTTKRKISKLGAKQSVYIPKNTLIITIQGSIGRVAITQYEAYIDRTLLLFTKFKKPINKLLFGYILKNLFDIEKKKAPGGIIKTITKEVLSNFLIKIPPTLQEQQKIADTFSSLDNLIEAQTKKIELLKEHKKALMQKMFVREAI